MKRVILTGNTMIVMSFLYPNLPLLIFTNVLIIVICIKSIFGYLLKLMLLLSFIMNS